MTDGLVFDIQRYSIHDGPGIRTVVFLKGCPLACLWCANPEGQRPSLELEFFAARCQACGRCVQVCPREAVNPDLDCSPSAKISRDRCDGCGLCVDACPSGALALKGRRMTVDAVMAEVKKDSAYYRRSGGGVTLSGGEPVAQPRFAREILLACRDANIHAAVETCGHAVEEVFRLVAEPADLVLYDLKHMDPEAHRGHTGVSNTHVLSNLRWLARQGKPTVIRLPLVPGSNDSLSNLDAVGNLAAGLSLRQIHLMPFHQLGRDKYARLGRDYALADLAPLRRADAHGEALLAAKARLEAHGLEVLIGG